MTATLLLVSGVRKPYPVLAISPSSGLSPAIS